MSIRMACTLEFGARSAICRHSAAFALHSIGFITLRPRTVYSRLSSNPALLMDSKLELQTFNRPCHFGHTLRGGGGGGGKGKKRRGRKRVAGRQADDRAA